MESFEEFYYTSKDRCDHRFEDEKYRNQYYSNLETWSHQQAKIDKLEADKKELVKALYVFQSNYSYHANRRLCTDEDCYACQVLTKMKSKGRDK